MTTNRVFLNQRGLIHPIPLKYEGMESTSSQRFKKGELYTLKGESCEGFEMPTRVYQCKGVVDSLSGIDISSLVMKQVDGAEETIFSLSRSDCKILGIDYEERLQLFPNDFDWAAVKESKKELDFDIKNLATYKPSPIDGTIKQMHVYFGLIHKISSDSLATPHNVVMPIDLFLNSLHFTFRDAELRKQFPCVIKPILINGKNGSIFDPNGGIHLMLFFSVGNSKGIKPEVFEGLCLDDIFEVSWDEPYFATKPQPKCETKSWIMNDFEYNRSLTRLRNASYNCMNESLELSFGKIDEQHEKLMISLKTLEDNLRKIVKNDSLRRK